MEVATQAAFREAIPHILTAISATVPDEARNDPASLLRWFNAHPESWAVVWTSLSGSLDLTMNDLVESLKSLTIDGSNIHPNPLATRLIEGSGGHSVALTVSAVEVLDLTEEDSDHDPRSPRTTSNAMDDTSTTESSRHTRPRTRRLTGATSTGSGQAPGDRASRWRFRGNGHLNLFPGQGGRLRERITSNFKVMCEGKPVRRYFGKAKSGNEVLELIIKLQHSISLELRALSLGHWNRRQERSATDWRSWSHRGPALEKLIWDMRQKLAGSVVHDDKVLKAVLGWESSAELQIVDLT